MVLKLHFTVFVVIVVFVSNSDATHTIRTASSPIGGLFNSHTEGSSLQAFKYIAPESYSNTYYGRVLSSKVLDSYSTALELCEFTSDNKGIVALMDARPTEGICDAICLLCNKYNIPHLSIGWEPIDTLADNTFTLSYYPPLDIISKAYTELIKHLSYDKFTIFYEDDSTFIRLQDVINSRNNKEPIIFSQLDPNSDNRETFKNIFKEEHMSYHIIDCKVENILNYFKEIVEIADTRYQSFILSNLDAYTVDIREVPKLMANVSTLHLTTTASEDRWRDIGMATESPVMLETALAADALYHLEKAIQFMLSGEEAATKLNKDLHNPPALCYQNEKADYEDLVWPLGPKLQDALYKNQANGFTGHIEFDEVLGKRINFALHYSKLNLVSEFVHVGIWDSRTNKLNASENNVHDRASSIENLVRVTTRVGEPYVYEIKTDEGVKLVGYAVDLVEKIFDVIRTHREPPKYEKLQYVLSKVPDNEYGRKVEGTRKWNGIMGQLIDHEADMAILDLTITSERNAVIDFSIPFMTLGISILMRNREAEPPQMFSFLLPLSLDVWLYLATTYIIVSFILLICARMSQDDWVNPHPCNQNPENLQNIWSFYNCMWLTMGAIMCQGCDILPRAAGSRWIAGMWWFFALIVTSSYTANLSTFLSEGRRNDDIKSVKDLAEQHKVTYGAVVNASTYTFFKNSNDTTYSKLWSVMFSAKPTVFTKKNEEGMLRVMRSKGNYAFFMESTAIEYYTKRHCELKMVGDKLDSKEYGVAFPKSSTFKEHVDFAILHLQETGKLDELKQKWWVEKFNDQNCKSDSKDEEDDGSLKMETTSGIFLVLGLGGILGLIVAIIDFLLNAEQISVKEKITFQEALISEWRASLDPKALQKKAAPPRSVPPSTASPSPRRERSQSRAVSVLRAASSFINFDEIY